MGDLILFAKKGYAFQAPAQGEQEVADSTGYLGTHRYRPPIPSLMAFSLPPVMEFAKEPSCIASAISMSRQPLAAFLKWNLCNEGRVLEEFLAPPR
jgi:hypothetical protein